MSSSYRQELDKWLSQLDVKAFSVGDVGGAQLPVQGRTRTWEVGKTTIYDLPSPHNGPPPDVQLDLNTATVFPLSTHDMIFCLEVAEYLWNPSHAVFVLAQMLTSGGALWMTFPSFYPHHNPVDDDCLRYMEGGIRKLAASAGLEIVKMIPRRPETSMLQQAWVAERMRAAKGFDHAVTGWIVEFTK